MEITKEWLEDNHFTKFGEYWELNQIHLDTPRIDNHLYVSVKHKKIEIGHSSSQETMNLEIPFTTESLSGFIKLYGKTKRELYEDHK